MLRNLEIITTKNIQVEVVQLATQHYPTHQVTFIYSYV